jgi:hypothetical protein
VRSDAANSTLVLLLPRCLATIEAIYYFFNEFILAREGKYDGECDNLLYFFVQQYQLIQAHYKQNPKSQTQRFQKKMRTGYIQAQEGQGAQGGGG